MIDLLSALKVKVLTPGEPSGQKESLHKTKKWGASIFFQTQPHSLRVPPMLNPSGSKKSTVPSCHILYCWDNQACYNLPWLPPKRIISMSSSEFYLLMFLCVNKKSICVTCPFQVSRAHCFCIIAGFGSKETLAFISEYSSQRLGF